MVLLVKQVTYLSRGRVTTHAPSQVNQRASCAATKAVLHEAIYIQPREPLFQ
jgi:hypothetical protein